MRITKPGRRPPDTLDPARAPDEDSPGVVGRVSGTIEIARGSAARLIERVPAVVRATRAGMDGTTAALQTLPDSTLQWIAATSVGLAAGLRLAGAPRLVSAAGAAPALIVGAAMALRPAAPAIPVHEHAGKPSGGIPDLTDEHTKGAISKATGTVEEELGKLTGDKERQAHGKAKQLQGAAQKSLGDVEDAIRGSKDKA